MRTSAASEHRLDRLVSRTFAEIVRPMENSMVEFWGHRMSCAGKPGTGITGWFRDGRFWSHDDADYWECSEIVMWTNLRNALQCAARGCDGCRVCAANKS